MTKEQRGEDRPLRSVLEVKNAYLPALARSQSGEYGEELADRNAEVTARTLREIVGKEARVR